MDTKLLRQKILDLAIRGKLVPQDPNDEPASVLLERIKAEKERLIKEGKIKRSKQSTSTSDSRHYPFELPNGWTWCKLGEIFQHNNGKQKTSSNQKGELYKYITTSNVYWQYFDLTEVKEMRFLESELDKCTATKGDLLICEGGDVGRAAIWNNDYSICFQNHLHRLRAYLPVCTQYFLYCLMFNKFIGLIKGKGIGLMSLSANELHNISIPLPPLNEQKRIVAEIERWYDLVVLIEKRKDDLHTAINQAKSKILSLAIHGKLVPQDPADEPASELLKRVNPSAEITCDNEHYPQLPSGWIYVRGKDVFRPLKSTKPTGTNFKYIDIDSIDNKNQCIKQLKIVDSANAPSRASRYTRRGDVVFSMVRPYLRNIAIVPEDDCIASTGFYICSPTNAMTTKYCYYLMISDYVVNGLNQFMNGDNSPSINKSNIEDWLFPIPPLNEQIIISNTIERLYNHLDSMVVNL